MTAIHQFVPGDFLIFQLESGYALLRVLHVDDGEGENVWHVAAYRDFYLDPDSADAALDNPGDLVLERDHVAITNRAFESTQMARLRNLPLVDADLSGYRQWAESEDREVADRSIRLLLGLR